jgi:multicomponent Na+:H+ antiporter subunit B
MIRPQNSVIVDLAVRIMAPMIQIFGFYVIFHGHYSPGGGFQGGALLAASILLQRVVLGRRRSARSFPPRLAILFGAVGIGIFASVGLWSLLAGGNLLQYDHLPLGLSVDMLRNTGILLVEIGIAFAVMGTLISIYDDLSNLRRKES